MVRGIVTTYIYSEVTSHMCQVLRLLVHVIPKLIKKPDLLVYVHVYTPPYVVHLFVNRAILKKT